MNTKFLAVLLVVFSCFCFTAYADDAADNVTVDLNNDTVGEATELQGSGSTFDSQDGEVDMMEAYGQNVASNEVDNTESRVRIDTSGDDPYVLEEYSPNEYNTYDFSQVLPIKFQTENKKEAYITNRANRLTLAKVDVTLHTKENVRGQNAKLGLTEYSVQASVPVLYKGQNKLMFTVNYDVFDFDTDMRLNNRDFHKFPKSKLGAVLPVMKSLSFMMNYRYEIENTDFAGGFFNGTTIGVDAIVDSRSDKLFNSLDETNLTSFVSFRLPIFENQAITVLAGYVSDFKLPIAGVAYQLNFGKTSYLNVGVPLTQIHVNSSDIPGVDTERFNFDFNYIVLGDLRTQLSYDIILGKLQIFTDFEWNTNTWARADREDKRSRVFYTDCRFGGGVRADFFKYFYAQVEGGIAFARNIYEERRYFMYNRGYDIDSSAYLKLEAGIVF